MAEFRTEISLEASSVQIKHTDKLLLLGSCFAEHISTKLNYYKFHILENPFGILYNPHSIFNFIHSAIHKKRYIKEDLHVYEELFCHFDAHGRLNHPDPDIVVKRLNESINNCYNFLREAQWIFISLGTSYYFRLNENGQVVANCHKFPANRFSRKMLSVEENAQILEKTIQALKSFNPNIHVVLTISPVRHIRDGFIQNQSSKASLHLAMKEIIEKYPEINYFPAYEILLDDLRDYRFYTSDMIHPNQEAVDYIWKKFNESYISEESQEIIKLLDKLLQSIYHRPLHPGTEKHQQFLEKLLEKLNKFQARYPLIDVSKEIQNLSDRLSG